MSKLLLAVTLAFFPCSFAGAGTLFYGGDSANVGAVTNSGGYMGYDAFVVPAGGWDLSSVFSNDQVFNIPLPFIATGGTWEIWTDLGQADQSLVASGSTLTNFSWTATGRGIPFVYGAEFTLLIYGLDVHLDSGTYWLGVSPFDFDSEQVLIGGTSGQNAVGNPVGSQGMALLHTPDGALIPTADLNAGMFDLSMGINGTAAPEPTTFVPVCAAALAVLLRRPLLGLCRSRTR
jgi:hypothetical protein